MSNIPTHTVTLSTGKKLTIQQPNVLAQYRLVAALGELAENRVYLAMVTPLIYLAAIDDDAVMQPRTLREIEGLITRLDDEGLRALTDAIAEHFGGAGGQEEVDTARKSQPIPA